MWARGWPRRHGTPAWRTMRALRTPASTSSWRSCRASSARWAHAWGFMMVATGCKKLAAAGWRVLPRHGLAVVRKESLAPCWTAGLLHRPLSHLAAYCLVCPRSEPWFRPPTSSIRPAAGGHQPVGARGPGPLPRPPAAPARPGCTRQGRPGKANQCTVSPAVHSDQTRLCNVG